MKIMLLILLALCCGVTIVGQEKEAGKLPYGSMMGGTTNLDVEHLMETHAETIGRLEMKGLKVDVMVMPDDYWYFSIEDNGKYGVANMDGKIVIPAEYSTCYYCPQLESAEVGVLQRDQIGKVYNLKIYTPSSKEMYIVEKDGKYDMLDIDGGMMRENIGDNPIVYNYYIMTGVTEKGVSYGLKGDSIPQMILRGEEHERIHIYDANGKEIETTLAVDSEQNDTVLVVESIFTPIEEGKKVKGRVRIVSDRKAKVAVDGTDVGKAPMTLEIDGRHNIRVEADRYYYYPLVKVIDVQENDSATYQFSPVAVKPRMYMFAMAQYGVSSGSYGVMVGKCKMWGGYVKLMGCGLEDPNKKYGPSTNTTEMLPVGEISGKYARICSGGVMRRLNKYVFAHGGAGYAKYTPGIYKSYVCKICPSYVSGVTLDLGLVAKYKWATLSVGATPMVYYKERRAADSYGDIHLGLGIALYKHKK